MSLSRRAALGAGIAASAYLVAAKPAAAQSLSLNLPSTSLAGSAKALIDAQLPPFLRNHSVRGFLLGRAIAERQGLRPGADYDEETMFLICALHDIGLADIANGDQRFEIDGADYAARFLEDNGVTDARVDTIWDTVAAHLSGFTDSPVWRRRRPPETWIAVDGIGVDVGGAPTDLPPGFADLVHAAYPRLGGSPRARRGGRNPSPGESAQGPARQPGRFDPAAAPPGTAIADLGRDPRVERLARLIAPIRAATTSVRAARRFRSWPP
ncbi:HD domain-containing protein [Nocardia beijingensis]|uniref:HD domain-containing protein n=1 Tax=Nocardia beijingensis TaxID=95162 RepID=UPI00340C4773